MGVIETTAGVRLAWEQAGEGADVVGLHGLTASRRYVLMGSRALERGGHRVLLYDARGHGASSPAPSPDAYGYDSLCSDLRQLLDACGVQRAVLVGASMGAHTIVRFALQAPQRVAGVVLATPAYDPADVDDPRRLQWWDALASGLRAGGVEGFLAAYDARVPERWRETVVKVIRQRLALHEHLDAVADALHAVPRSRPFDDFADLEAIAVPAIVVGSRDEADPEHPLAVAQRYAAAIPGARLVVEDPGSSPIAWQGGRMSRLVAELAAADAR
jgi:pimeloyl-ACP methyl ester carboxylesterase